jgi:hypothetical protein
LGGKKEIGVVRVMTTQYNVRGRDWVRGVREVNYGYKYKARN